jgi:hypothetical protein
LHGFFPQANFDKQGVVRPPEELAFEGDFTGLEEGEGGHGEEEKR